MAQKALHPQAPARQTCGFLGVREDGIVGFAWDPEQPGRSLDVELSLHGEVIGRVTANQEDEDAALHCGGPHAFRYRLETLPELPCEIAGRVGDTTFGPLRIEDSTQLGQAVDPSVRYEGEVDEFLPAKGRLHGWVIDKINPNARVRVTLRDWEEPLLAVQANIHRPELELRGKCGGHCAFAIHLPAELLDGNQHTLRVTVEDTNVALAGCPVFLEPEMARSLVEVIAPWREDVLRIEAALPRLDQLAEEIEATNERNTAFQRMRTALDIAGAAYRIKTRALRILDLVSRVLIASFTEQGMLDAECLVKYQLPAAQVASAAANESAPQHG
jgi:hypothetical protein